MKKEVEAAEEGREETEERAEVKFQPNCEVCIQPLILGSCKSGEGLGGKAEVGGILTCNLRGIKMMPCLAFIIFKILRQVRLKDFAENDPAVMEQMVKETKDALEATNRY